LTEEVRSCANLLVGGDNRAFNMQQLGIAAGTGIEESGGLNSLVGVDYYN
jgi:hypothetical protein